MKISLIIIFCIIILCVSTNENEYVSSYNYLLANTKTEIQHFANEEGTKNIELPIDIVVSREIISLEAIFFESKSNELIKWDTFKDVKNVKKFLFDLDSENSFDSYISENELVQNDVKSSNLIMFFSIKNKGLLLAELIWTKDHVDSNTNYNKVAMFGRSLRFLFEISETNEVKNVICIEVFHN